MFQKLRLKLTLINVTIMLTLFFLLIFCAYFFLEFNIARHNESFSGRIAADIQAGIIDDLPLRPAHFPKKLPPPEKPPDLPVLAPPGPAPGPPPGSGFFFVKVSSEGKLISRSSNQPLDELRLTDLTEHALLATANQDKITLDETTYYYLKAPLTDQPGTVIIFHDLTQENDMLRLVLTTLLAVGIICAILSFGSSFYMANRAMKPVKQAWRQQQNLISDVSHELRTPLTIIQTNLDIIKDSQAETVASQNRWLDNIQEESISMRNLVNSLLFLARADSKRQQPQKMLFSLDIAFQQAVTPFESIALQKHLLLEKSFTSLIECYGDESQIKQVIAILLDNACRHTDPGGKISVAVKEEGSNIQLSVSDSGEGIAPEHFDKIFDRFYQVDKSRNKGGSGLGLAIAKWIVENHGGSITVSSKPGVGTTFTIQLPSKPNI